MRVKITSTDKPYPRLCVMIDGTGKEIENVTNIVLEHRVGFVPRVVITISNPEVDALVNDDHGVVLKHPDKTEKLYEVGTGPIEAPKWFTGDERPILDIDER